MNANPPTSIQAFAFERHSIRSVTMDGKPWFVASDVCRVLGLGNVSLAVNGNPSRPEIGGLDDDERGVCSVKVTSDITKLEGHSRARHTQSMMIVSESGLYALIFKSRKAEAKRFRKWVTNVVLPTIRKTGGYHHGVAIPGSEQERAAVKVLLAAADCLGLQKNILQRITPTLSDYGRTARNGMPKVGLRRAAFVAGRQRSLDAAAVITFCLQLELPLFAVELRKGARP